LEVSFLARPNRFVVLARLRGPRGRTVRAHCANPGRLAEILVPGRTLLLERRAPGVRRGLPYVVAAACYQDTIVPLRPAQVNRLAAELILPALYPEARLAGNLRREVPWGRSRLDFLLQRRNEQVLIEAKSVTLVEEGVAMFPDGQTARGLRHLEELAASSTKGLRPELLFVVQNPQARRFLPDFHTDPAFSRRLLELRGVLSVRAALVRTSADGEARLERLHLPVDWEAAAPALEDRGSYLLPVRLTRETVIEVGSLGPLRLAAGHYVYVGSAMGGLSARLARHLRRAGRRVGSRQWHIDSLLERVGRRDLRPLPIRSLQRLECRLAEDVRRLADREIAGFGCTDCRCSSHLLYFREDPLVRESFLALLFRYRNRLALGRPQAGSG
jgi:sugar fermentation stimulation protein A